MSIEWIFVITFTLFAVAHILPLIFNQAYRDSFSDWITFRDLFGIKLRLKHPWITTLQLLVLLGPVALYMLYSKLLAA